MPEDYTVIVTVDGFRGDPTGLDVREVEAGRVEVRLALQSTSAAWAVMAARRKLEKAATDPPQIRSVVAMPSWDYRKRADELPLLSLASVEDAAAILGTGRQRVRQLIDGGQLPATKLGRDWLLRRVDVEARRERRDRYERLYQAVGG